MRWNRYRTPQKTAELGFRALVERHHLLFLLSIVMGTVLAAGCGKRLGPADIVVAQPVQAVADARRLLEEKRQDPKKYTNWILPADVPSSLQLPGLVCAVVHEDHVDLLLQRIPDWWVGARIWSTAPASPHADRPTAYADIFFFTYSNDFPDSPENRR